MAPEGTCPTCSAHPLLVENVTALRQTVDLFISHAAEEHTRIREEQARQSETFHRELIETVRMIGERHAPPGAPHPLQRAEDYDQRVVLQLSRKDLWKILGAVTVLVVLVVGLALIAGRDGLDLWGKTVARQPPAVPR
jgi:hypothetical protein